VLQHGIALSHRTRDPDPTCARLLYPDGIGEAVKLHARGGALSLLAATADRGVTALSRGKILGGPQRGSANQPNQSVTHQADPEVDSQSPIDLVAVVLRARWQKSFSAEVNCVPGQHSNQGLPGPPAHEARFSSRAEIMKFTGFRVSFAEAAAEGPREALRCDPATTRAHATPTMNGSTLRP
jgi:hypothetical protein